LSLEIPVQPKTKFKGQPFTDIYFDDQIEVKYGKRQEFPSNGNTDVIIACSDGHFGIHRLVLSLASEFIRELLAGVSTYLIY
jgi:hypothetical protein